MSKTVSDKQLAANRANAERSTGPRTEAGKARAARNALTHGLASEAFHILRVEHPDQFEQLRANAVDLYQPVNAEELLAVERIALANLAMVRAARLEAGLFTRALNDSLAPNNVRPHVPLDRELADNHNLVVEQTRNYCLADGFERMTRAGNVWSLFFRYQAQAERQYRRAVEAFDVLKSRRDPDAPNEPISPAGARPPLFTPLPPPIVLPPVPSDVIEQFHKLNELDRRRGLIPDPEARIAPARSPRDPAATEPPDPAPPRTCGQDRARRPSTAPFRRPAPPPSPSARSPRPAPRRQIRFSGSSPRMPSFSRVLT